MCFHNGNWKLHLHNAASPPLGVSRNQRPLSYPPAHHKWKISDSSLRLNFLTCLGMKIKPLCDHEIRLQVRSNCHVYLAFVSAYPCACHWHVLVVARGDGGALYDMKSREKVIRQRLICVNHHLEAVCCHCLRRRTHSDNAPNIRWEERELAEKRLPDLIVCLRLLFVLHK